MKTIMLLGALLASLNLGPTDEQAKLEALSNYLAAWSEADLDKCTEYLEACYSPTGEYSDPLSLYPSRKALIAGIQVLQAQNPGATFSFLTQPRFHHNFAQFDWVMLDAEGNVALEGEDFVMFAQDGKITRVTGFFDPQN